MSKSHRHLNSVNISLGLWKLFRSMEPSPQKSYTNEEKWQQMTPQIYCSTLSLSLWVKRNRTDSLLLVYSAVFLPAEPIENMKLHIVFLARFNPFFRVWNSVPSRVT